MRQISCVHPYAASSKLHPSTQRLHALSVGVGAVECGGVLAVVPHCQGLGHEMERPGWTHRHRHAHTLAAWELLERALPWAVTHEGGGCQEAQDAPCRHAVQVCVRVDLASLGERLPRHRTGGGRIREPFGRGRVCRCHGRRQSSMPEIRRYFTHFVWWVTCFYRLK